MDIRLQSGLPRHPKLRKLHKRLGGAGVVGLIWLWLFASENHQTGSLDGMEVEDIELAAEWDGEPGKLVETLVELRWLDGESGSFALHDWSDWQPWIIDAPHRSEVARSAANARWKRPEPKKKGDPDRFEKWLDEVFLPKYPEPHRNEQRPGALAYLRQAKPSTAELEEFVTALEALKRTPKWLKDGGQYVPGPGNFFRNNLHKTSTASATTNGHAAASGPDSQDILRRQREAIE
jgi:hypothetical protein